MSYSSKYPTILKSEGQTIITYGNNTTGRKTYMVFIEHPYTQKRKVIIEKIFDYNSIFWRNKLVKNGYNIIRGGYSSNACASYSTIIPSYSIRK